MIQINEEYILKPHQNFGWEALRDTRETDGEGKTVYERLGNFTSIPSAVIAVYHDMTARSVQDVTLKEAVNRMQSLEEELIQHAWRFVVEHGHGAPVAGGMNPGA